MIVMIEYLLARDFSIAQPDKGILKNVKACPLQESGEWQMATHVPELAACILDIYIYIYIYIFMVVSDAKHLPVCMFGTICKLQEWCLCADDLFLIGFARRGRTFQPASIIYSMWHPT